MRNKRDNQRTLNFLHVVLAFVALSVLSLAISTQLFWFVGGFAVILILIYLVMIWDEIVIWWSTRKSR